jgi:hypothetical protein
MKISLDDPSELFDMSIVEEGGLCAYESLISIMIVVKGAETVLWGLIKNILDDGMNSL